MNNNKKAILNLLGIARRAGQIKSGEGTVLQAVRNEKTNLVFLAKDAGAATKKKVMDKCNFYQVTLCQLFTKQELSQAIGQPRTIICITQSGFTRKFEELLTME
ncbi:YlxQ-related RNA-binding protein [Lactobacillaceae bacterium 24-114]